MNFPKANSFPTSVMRERSMGPNPLKLCEELLAYGDIPASSVVLDLGSGAGLTSALLARECGLTVYAADLWSDPSDNMRFFEGLGLTNRQVVPLKADATALPENISDPSGMLDALRIENLSEAHEDPFGLDVVLAYFLRLRIAANAARPSAEAGRERLRQVVAAVSHL